MQILSGKVKPDGEGIDVAALQAELKALRAIVDSLPQRLLWKGRDSVFRGCNRAAADELGLARTSDIVGKTERDLHADAMEADYLRRNDEAVMASGRPTYHADVAGKQPGFWLDVSKIPLCDENGEVDGLLIGYEDVSEQRRNRIELGNFRQAVERSSSMVLMTDPHGNIEYVNPRFLEFYGYAEHEVLGRNPRLMKSGETPPEVYRTLWQTIRTGNSWRGEFHNRARDGRLYWVTASISPVLDENGECLRFLAIQDDITERKQLEQDLRRQLAFTQTLMNALPNPVYFKDREGIYRGSNRAMEELLGLAPGGIVGKSVFDLHPPEIARIYKVHDDDLLAHPGMQSYETKLRDRDGCLRDIFSHKATYLDEHGEVAGIIGSVLDISDRKLAEAALQESEQRFRTISNYTYNWENWVSPEGKLLWVNPAVKRMTGYSPEECMAMEGFPAPLLHPDDLPFAMKHYAESVAAIEHAPLECRMVRKDGSVRWIEVAVAQVFDDAGSNIGHRSSIRDVTDRHRAMEELQVTRDFLQTVLDQIPQGVFWKDLEGRYQGGNKAFAQALGMDLHTKILGRTDLDLFSEAEAQHFRRADSQVMASGTMLRGIEEVFTDGEGGKHYALTVKSPLHDAFGEVIGVLGSFADVTEMKQVESELRESEARLREVAETVAEGIYVMDEAAAVIYANPEAESLLGHDRGGLLGKSGYELFAEGGDKQESKGVCRIVTATLAGRKYVSEKDRFRRKDGTTFDVSIHATPIIREGEYFGAVIAFHDITEQKLTQRLLHEALAKVKLMNTTLGRQVREKTEENIEKERLLIQQSRSAAMGEMISNIAHQWRQPLSTLGLVVQNILYDYRENRLSADELEKYAETAQSCVARMSETIDDFRDFFRPDKAKVRFGLHEAVTASLQLLSATLKNNNIAVSVLGDAGLQAYGHPNEFSQVVLNILANAKEALVANRARERRIDIELVGGGEKATVLIRDNAGGIPEQLMEKIFDPYFTTKSGGTGIGLYMSKTIIEKHMGGHISCRNAGEGAEFEVGIPLGAGQNGEAHHGG